jgi:FemAB-related protein (PEP-CTERM system-associated)
VSVAVERFAGPAAEWDAFVAARPEATHCHLHAWKRVIEGVYGHDCPYLSARDGEGRLTGVLPLADVRALGFGRFFVSLPYLNYGGPLGDAESVRALAARAAAMASEARADLLELRCAAPVDAGLARVDEKVTCVLDLPAGGADALWAAFPAKLRSQVRRPEKEGAEIRFGPGELDAFFAVFARNMRDLGTPTHPRAFFAALLGELGERAWIGCVHLGGRPVAGGCAVRHGSTVEMVWASSLREASAAAPNMLLYWAFLRRAAEEGLATFDFGRCTPGGGTHRFKRQWGARDVPLPWYRALRRPGAAAPAADRGAYALGARVWRRLPLAVANLLGPSIRGAIPS